MAGKKNIPKKKVAKKLPEEDAESVFKKVKKTGKAVFDGPKSKERKKSAPATQVHKKKKGKGSFDRKKLKKIEENNNLSKFISAVLEKSYSEADKYLKAVVESKLSTKIEEELSTPLF